MKRKGLIALLAALGLRVVVGAEEAPGERYRAECRMVIVWQADALTLVPELQEDAKIEAAWTRLEGMLRKGDATLVGDLLARGTLGERVQSETQEELRYATNFEPPKLPTEIPRENAAELLKSWPHVGITPTDFETRNIGQVLETEVKRAKPDGLLWVNAMVQHVRFLRWARTDAGRLASGERLSVEQPIFHTMKRDGKFPLQNGRRILLSVHKVPDSEKPAFELFLLRVTIEPPIRKP